MQTNLTKVKVLLFSRIHDLRKCFGFLMSRNDKGEKGEHQRKQQHTAATSDTHLGHIPALIATFKM